jgi:plasmid stability protein
MSDLLIRNVTARMKRKIREQARLHGRSLSEQAKILLDQALSKPGEERRLGTELFNLIRPEDRGEDLVFEFPTPARQPPDFE